LVVQVDLSSLTLLVQTSGSCGVGPLSLDYLTGARLDPAWCFR